MAALTKAKPQMAVHPNSASCARAELAAFLALFFANANSKDTRISLTSHWFKCVGFASSEALGGKRSLQNAGKFVLQTGLRLSRFVQSGWTVEDWHNGASSTDYRICSVLYAI